MKHFAALLALGLLPVHAFAESPLPSDPYLWLERMATAAHQLNYSGTFIYRYRGQIETSRIVHKMDETGEHEKLEALDGPPREIIRSNDEIYCYLPNQQAFKMEKRGTRKVFPALLPKQLSDLAVSYIIRLGTRERIAGYDCQNIVLEPRDGFRYGHRFCAELNSALLLKAIMLNEKNVMVDQFSFTHIKLGGPIDNNEFKPKLAGGVVHWQGQQPIVADTPAGETGWIIKQPPAGFKRIMEMKRGMPGKKMPIAHLVFSDGLAAVSIFVEPMVAGAHPMDGLSNQGAINIYAKALSENQITVLGEVPAATVMQIGNSVISKPR